MFHRHDKVLNEYENLPNFLLIFLSLRKTCIYIFTTEGFFNIAIESWPEWGLNTQPLNSKWAIRPWVQLSLRSNFVTATPISLFVQCQVSFWLLPLSGTTFILIKISLNTIRPAMVCDVYFSFFKFHNFY